MKKINCILLIDDNPADNEFHKIIIEEADVCDCIKMVSSGPKALEYLINAVELQPSSQAFLRPAAHPGEHTSDHEILPSPQEKKSPAKPDLIFLDINMPGMNGFEFLEKYHALDEKLKSKIMIIMLTTSLNPDDRIKAMENNEVTEFETKPLTVELLREIVEKYF